MNKISYISKKHKKMKSVKNLPVLNTDTSKEDGSRGYIMPGMYNGQPFLKNEEGDGSITQKLEDYEKTPYSDLKNFLIDMSDELDLSGEDKLADFNDFLLTKVAEVEKVDYSKEFNNIIKAVLKLNILEKELLIKKLTKIFNSYIINNSSKDGLDKSKLNAYMLVKKEFNKYV